MISIKDLFSLIAKKETPEEMEKGKLQELLDECWKQSLEIEKNPENADAYNQRGWIRCTLKLYEDAETDFSKALELEPNNAAFLRNMGFLKLNSNAPAQAIEYLNAALESKPEPNALLFRGMAYSQLREFEKAAQDLETTVEIEKGLIPYLTELGETEEAEEIKNNIPFTYCRLIDVNKELGEYEKIVENCTEWLVFKTDALAYFRRGEAKSVLKDSKGALADLNEAIKLKQNLVKHCLIKAYMLRGTLKAGLDDKLGAIADFNEAMKLEPDWEDPYMLLGLMRLGTQRAIDDFSTAIKINPKKTELYEYRGLAKVNKRRIEEAIEDYTKAIELGSKRTFYCRSKAYVELGKEDLAKQDMEKYNALPPELRGDDEFLQMFK